MMGVVPYLDWCVFLLFFSLIPLLEIKKQLIDKKAKKRNFYFTVFLLFLFTI